MAHLDQSRPSFPRTRNPPPVRRNDSTSFPFFPKQGETKKGNGNKDNPTGPFTIEIDEIGVSAGKSHFFRSLPEAPFKTTLSPIEPKSPISATVRIRKTGISVSLATEAKETVKMEGSLSIQPCFRQRGALKLKCAPRKYSPYYRERIRFEITEGESISRPAMSTLSGERRHRFR